jgi:hypothetical protein
VPARNDGQIRGKEKTAGGVASNGDNSIGKLLDFTLPGAVDMDKLHENGRAFHGVNPECGSLNGELSWYRNFDQNYYHGYPGDASWVHRLQARMKVVKHFRFPEQCLFL